MKTAKTVIGSILASAKNHDDGDRMVRTIKIGEWVRQGDINIQRVERSAVKGKEIKDHQLAPGNTKGSRHILETGKRVRILSPGLNDPLQGPFIVAQERFTVTHPEHSNISLPSGSYAVTYQRDLAQENRARVMD